MIPLWDTIFTNKEILNDNKFQLINNVKNFENINLKIERNESNIEISFKLTYSVNIFIVNDNKYYYVSFNPKLLLEYFSEDHIVRHYAFFDKLILNKDIYKFTYSKNELYVIPINSSEGINIIKNWINRYINIVQNITPSNLNIEMSAGIDTRVLSYFWRNTNNEYLVYTKNDPDEYEDAVNVINYINDNFLVSLNTTSEKNNLKSHIVLNGGNIIHGLYRTTSVYDFYNVINNPFKSQKAKHIIKDICPYYDKDYLKIKCEYPGQLKIVLLKYLCEEKDLIKLPIKSFERKNLNPFSIEFNVDNILDKLKKGST